MARRSPRHNTIPHAGRRRPNQRQARERTPKRFVQRRSGPPTPRQGKASRWTLEDAEALLTLLASNTLQGKAARDHEAQLEDARTRVAGAFPSKPSIMALSYVMRHGDEAEHVRWMEAFGGVREHDKALPHFTSAVREGGAGAHEAVVELVQRLRAPAGEPFLIYVITRSRYQNARIKALDVWSEQGTRGSLEAVAQAVSALPSGKLRDRAVNALELAHERYGIIAGTGSLTEVNEAGGLTVAQEMDRGALEVYREVEEGLGIGLMGSEDAEVYDAPPPPYLPVFVGVVAMLLVIMAIVVLVF